MNQKKLLILLAAVMLTNLSVFAQNGDVNSDGIVDVADITAVIKIMKDAGGTATVGSCFYLGTAKPTEENYKTLPGLITSYTSINDAIGTTISVDAGQTLYMLCPAKWIEGKNGRRGKCPWIVPLPPDQNILVQRNSCRRKVVPLHHGKETFNIRL